MLPTSAVSPACPPSRTGHEARLESVCQLQAGGPGCQEDVRDSKTENQTLYLQMLNVSRMQSSSGI